MNYWRWAPLSGCVECAARGSILLAQSIRSLFVLYSFAVHSLFSIRSPFRSLFVLCSYSIAFAVTFSIAFWSERFRRSAPFTQIKCAWRRGRRVPGMAARESDIIKQMERLARGIDSMSASHAPAAALSGRAAAFAAALATALATAIAAFARRAPFDYLSLPPLTTPTRHRLNDT